MFTKPLLPWKINKYYIFISVCACVRVRGGGVNACVCVRVCVCMDARARACACARVAVLIQHATRMRHIVFSFVASGSTIFFDVIS